MDIYLELIMDRNERLLRQKRETIAKSKEAQKQQLIEVIERGRTYQSLLNSIGWKFLLEDYLETEMDPQRLLNVLHNTDLLKVEAIKMQTLWDMLGYISQKIKSGYNASVQLEKLEGRDRRTTHAR